MNKPPARSDFVPLEALTANVKEVRYWRSLDDLNGIPHEEGPEDTGHIDESSRRRFLQLAGASLGLAGLTGCTRQPATTSR